METIKRWSAVLPRAAEGLLSLLFPPECISCGRLLPEETVVCESCLGEIRAAALACRRCGAPVGRHAETAECPSCRSRRFHFHRVVAAARYEGTTRRLVLQMKYARRRSAARFLGCLMAERVVEEGLAGSLDLLVPVPLHPYRLAERSFNQAELLAREVAEQTGIPLHTDILVRTVNTPPQVSLSASRRRSNVEGAFRIIGRVDLLEGKTVGVVDDVLTTGATISECARVLRRAGVVRVVGIVAARG